MLEIHGPFLQMQKNQKMRESSLENISKPTDEDIRAIQRKPYVTGAVWHFIRFMEFCMVVLFRSEGLPRNGIVNGAVRMLFAKTTRCVRKKS